LRSPRPSLPLIARCHFFHMSVATKGRLCIARFLQIVSYSLLVLRAQGFGLSHSCYRFRDGAFERDISDGVIRSMTEAYAAAYYAHDEVLLPPTDEPRDNTRDVLFVPDPWRAHGQDLLDIQGTSKATNSTQSSLVYMAGYPVLACIHIHA
jgi:hypothetical protein